MLRLAIKIMGNCLALQDKVIKVMKTDGEVLIYKAPTKVGQVLSDYSGHAISDTLPVVRHLRRVMKTDGEVLIYKAPTKVGQVLSDYSGHAISDTLPVVRHLRRDTDLVGGQLYYLLPLPLPSLNILKKKLSNSYSTPELAEAGDGSSTKVVRIKLVVNKQELEAMLRKGGVSVADLVSQLQKNGSSKRPEELNDEGNGNSLGWKPLLESIPE